MTRILVIDDEAPLREEIVDMLTFENFDVIYADNGRSGVKAAQEQFPDLVLCDITMPELDGYGVLLELQKDRVTATIPFIFLTARADKSFMRHGMELGADDYITKPFTRGELLAAIRTRLKRHSARMDAYRREIEEAKTTLTNMVAHELRTPLFSIRLVKDIIEHEVESLSVTETQRLMEMMGSGVDRLNHLVEQMVHLTYLETGSLRWETIVQGQQVVSVEELVYSAINLGRYYACRQKENGIRFDESPGAATIMAHPHALKHAVAELIANALNFSNEGDEVVVSCRQAEGSVWIHVLDHGIGMSPWEQKAAFGKFIQINREDREQQGMGLGLYVARGIIEAHQGSIELRSAAGQGTEVIVRLPLASETVY